MVRKPTNLSAHKRKANDNGDRQIIGREPPAPEEVALNTDDCNTQNLNVEYVALPFCDGVMGDSDDDSDAEFETNIAELEQKYGFRRIEKWVARRASSSNSALKLGMSGDALPVAAPEIWKDRDKTLGETPAAFLKRVYRRWLEADVGFTQATLRQLDEPGYMSFVQWKLRNPNHADLKDLNLPTKKESNDLLLATEAGSSLVREAHRLRSAAQRRHVKL